MTEEEKTDLKRLPTAGLVVALIDGMIRMDNAQKAKIALEYQMAQNEEMRLDIRARQQASMLEEAQEALAVNLRLVCLEIDRRFPLEGITPTESDSSASS